MGEDNLIQVRGLDRRYGKTQALAGLNFDLHRGEVLGFLGPNGAGKSTTMRIIAGVLAPSAGRVLIRGIDLLERPKAAKAHIGYLPEQPPLYRELTVDEYLRYCASLRGVPRKRWSGALRDVKDRCGLARSGRRLIGHLSKGYQQRVGIAQAIVHAPAVVVLDEPTVGLDPIQIREIRALIRQLGDDHGVILSTHILPEVQAVCDRVQIIHLGRLVLDESVENLSRGADRQSMRIGLRYPPPLTSVTAIPGIERAEALDENRLRIHHLAGGNAVDQLVERAVREQWGLFELIPESRSLEEVFVDLTCGDAQIPAGEAREARNAA